MTRSQGIRTAAAGLAVAAILGLTAPAFAAGPKPAGTGLTAAVEPATGKLRQPTAAENRALAEGVRAMLKSSAPLPLKQFADGTMSIELGASFLNISVAQVQPGGTLRQVCIDNAQSADALMNPIPAFEDK
ncbi:MAG: hypothetical protein ABIS20_04555 [Thermoanaerobaculia bacterium]